MSNEEIRYFVENLSLENFQVLDIYFDEYFKERVIERLRETGELSFSDKPIPIIELIAIKDKVAVPKLVSVKVDEETEELIMQLDSGESMRLSDLPYSVVRDVLNVVANKLIAVKRDEIRFSSTKKIHFDNEDIIITDPCYIIDPDEPSDWEDCGCGTNLEELGIDNYLTHDTIYGDWSCTTYDSDTKEELGKFTADTGQVSVLPLSKVRNYDPWIDDFIFNHQHCVTVIPGFTGDVWIDVKKIDDDYAVSVIGQGNINFETHQTGV